MLQSDYLGIALRFLRTARNLKQHQVAETAGITSSMLSGYENGRKVPTLVSLEKILQAMGYRLQDLVGALEMARDESSGGVAKGVEEKSSVSGGEGRNRPGSLRGGPFSGGLPARSSGIPWSQETFRDESSAAFDLDAILGPSPRLEREEQEAFEEMLSGYYRWLRFLHRHGEVARGDRGPVGASRGPLGHKG